MHAKSNIENAGKSIPMVSETYSLKIKRVLGASKGTIGSRFHGLVNALSQGVPSIATGWSHKYQMLFQDYDFEDGLSDVLIGDNVIKRKINYLIVEELRGDLSFRMKEKAAKEKDRAAKMWDQVFDIIGS